MMVKFLEDLMVSISGENTRSHLLDVGGLLHHVTLTRQALLHRRVVSGACPAHLAQLVLHVEVGLVSRALQARRAVEVGGG